MVKTSSRYRTSSTSSPIGSRAAERRSVCAAGCRLPFRRTLLPVIERTASTSSSPEQNRVTAAPTGSFSLRSRLRLAAADIKLTHSVFALPFALLGAFLARQGTFSTAGAGAGVSASPSRPLALDSRFALQLALIVLCMVLARTWAMLYNRLADRRIDALNPRTSRRIIAAGSLPVRDAWLIALGASVLFVGACSGFWWLFNNPWPAALSLPVLGFIAFYSLTKRFTMFCHLVLGAALAISPLAAAIAVRPESLQATPALWTLSAMVLCWVAGFDIIYALQDVEFDLQQRLHSIPSTLGPRGAIWASRLLHALAATLLLLAWKADQRLGPAFGLGVALVIALLVLEHIVLAKRGKAGIDMAFFTINGVVSCVLGLIGIADLTFL